MNIKSHAWDYDYYDSIDWLMDMYDEDYPPERYEHRTTKKEKLKEYANRYHDFAPDKPIHRFLRANVGRRWDEVYSELCATHKGIDRLKLEHYLHVEEGYYTRGETVYNSKHEQVNMKIGGHYDFFIIDGILRTPKVIVSHRSRSAGMTKEERLLEKGVVHKNGMVCMKRDGIWYQLILATIPKNPNHYNYRWDRFLDAMTCDLSKERLKFWYGTDKLYCKGWQQLGKRQLRLLGLSNE